MGTKLQCESYLHGYSSMRNSNEDSSTSWSSFYEEKTLNEHLYNGFMPRQVNECTGFYDKEMLKRTMLEHEAIFRTQVYELHRLYRIQKDLMDELKRKDIYKVPEQNGTTQSYLFSSETAPKTPKNIWNTPQLTETRTGLNFIQHNQIPRENGVCINLKPKVSKQMLDLQLPADVYIKTEDSDTTDCFGIRDNNSSMICDIDRENDVKLTLATGEGIGKGSLNSDLNQQNGRIVPSFDFLNEPKKGSSFNCFDEGSCSDFYNADKGKFGGEWPSFNYEDGRSKNTPNTLTFDLSIEPSDPILQCHEETQTWLDEKPSLSLGPYQNGSPFVDSKNLLLTVSKAIPCSDSVTCTLPAVSTKRKIPRIITHVPIAVQALPCFPLSAMMHSRNKKPKKRNIRSDVDLKPQSRVENELFATQNGFHQDPGSDHNKHSSDYENSEVWNTVDLNTCEIFTEDEVTHEIELEVLIPAEKSTDTLAAENLVALSSSATQHLPPAFVDSLHWFANVVSDYDDEFETLTLELEELKPDEHLFQEKEKENKKDVKLITVTKRRKKRQQKDFQKDILPGLISLSRHEVTEDLQAFDCLMSAMGEDWGSNLTRKCMGKKASDCPGKKRGRPRGKVIPVHEKILGPESTPIVAHPNLDIGDRSIIGWGRKTTRRGRRPRAKPNQDSLLH